MTWKLFGLIWKYRNAVASVILALAIFGLWLHSQHQAGAIARLKAEVSSQNHMIAACEKQKQISYEVSNEYQGRITDLNSKLASLRLRFDEVCIPVNQSPGRPNATPAEGKLPGQNGVYAGALLDFARDCEQERLKVIGLQDFITKANDAP